jgi:PIN domain nuclease of toxin-antitoxin system
VAIDAVLDASAILAGIKGEAGSERVLEAAATSCISAVNYAEVGSKMLEEGFSGLEMQETLLSLALNVVDFEEAQAMEVARLRPLTKRHGLGLGDRACLALAGLRRLAIITADRRWASLDLGVEVILIR